MKTVFLTGAMLFLANYAYSYDADLVRSKNPNVFLRKNVQKHLSKVIWQGKNLADDNKYKTVARAQTAWASQQREKVQEVRKGKIYHVSGFQLASQTIIVGDKGLIVVDFGENNEAAAKSYNAFNEATNFKYKDYEISAILFTHRHPDHAFGSAGFGVTEAD